MANIISRYAHVLQFFLSDSCSDYYFLSPSAYCLLVTLPLNPVSFLRIVYINFERKNAIYLFYDEL